MHARLKKEMTKTDGEMSMRIKKKNVSFYALAPFRFSAKEIEKLLDFADCNGSVTQEVR